MRRVPRVTALALLLTLAPPALDGCVSLRVAHAPASAGPSRVDVAVYDDEDARKADRLVDHPVFTHLLRVEKGRTVSVARSLAPRWHVVDLPPGRYRLEATKEIDAHGDIRNLQSGRARTFALAEKQVVRVDVLRKKVPVALIVVAVVTLVALAALAIDLGWLADLPDLPEPPSVSLPLEFAVAIDWSFDSSVDRDAAPAVADIFPARGSVVAARRLAVTFLLLVPLDGDPDPSAVSALGSLSGEIPGVVSYLPEERLLVFSPQRDFTEGESVTVTLDLTKLRSLSGTHGEGKLSTSFSVPE
jgi:hypothetical protein